MSLFRRRPTDPVPPPTGPRIADALQQVVRTAGDPALFADSGFVRRVSCPRCGAAKRLPSPTAYLYCDHCAALIDYDFRLANADTNAGLTNTVFHHLMAPVQAPVLAAVAAGDRDGYRQLMARVFAEWIRQCPRAVSPRARHDQEFRHAMVAYCVESALVKDFDPALAAIQRDLDAVTATLQRIPRPGLPWLAGAGIWPLAEGFRQLMDATYRALDVAGVLAIDPDRSPPGVPLRMEYSAFCQGWLPHLLPADGHRLLDVLGLTGEYVRADLSRAVTRRCGGCGAEQATLPDSRAVVCPGCGRRLDLGAGEGGCQGCGSMLCFPEGVRRIPCPYCGGVVQRV